MKKKKQRIGLNYINYIIKRNYSCIKLLQSEKKQDLTELLSHCLKCNAVFAEPGEQKRIFYQFLCVVSEDESSYGI